jgi:hypothetical protein
MTRSQECPTSTEVARGARFATRAERRPRSIAAAREAIPIAKLLIPRAVSDRSCLPAATAARVVHSAVACGIAREGYLEVIDEALSSIEADFGDCSALRYPPTWTSKLPLQ